MPKIFGLFDLLQQLFARLKFLLAFKAEGDALSFFIFDVGSDNLVKKGCFYLGFAYFTFHS